MTKEELKQLTINVINKKEEEERNQAKNVVKNEIMPHLIECAKNGEYEGFIYWNYLSDVNIEYMQEYLLDLNYDIEATHMYLRISWKD